MARALALAAIVGLGVLVAVLWGGSGLAIYLFFVVVLGGAVFALGSFGDWIQRTSRGRFDDDARRRR
jgi:hypothetical protein